MFVPFILKPQQDKPANQTSPLFIFHSTSTTTIHQTKHNTFSIQNQTNQPTSLLTKRKKKESGPYSLPSAKQSKPHMITPLQLITHTHLPITHKLITLHMFG
eukprot:TRINITY_DN1724_c0_g1_i13.p2 TRINITY_DN1724_c0_g1~~TRINITY_DN1724_c0_g1_i13.p2  ORF type:complete len:102 (+),score=14.30 TRINITY_DN1724_c0_g1_i13:2547-2852(+)